jgi:U3 small nucleolar RNA-associated protein 13
VLWTSDGKQFLCRDENKINIISIDSMDIERTIGSNDEDLIYTFILTSNDENLVSAHRSGLMKLWDMSNGDLKKTWKNLHTGPVSCLQFCSNLEFLASGGTDSLVRLWDFNNQVCKGTYKGLQGVVSVIAFHPNEEFLLASADDAKIQAWNIESREVSKTFSSHISKVTAISFTEDGKFFISSSRDKVLILWDFVSGNQLRTIPVYEGIECAFILPYHLELPNGIKLSDENKVYAATAGEEGVVKIWEVNDSKILYKQNSSVISRAEEEGGLAITQMHFNQQLQQLALVSYDHNIIVHDITTFTCFKQLIGFTDEILDLTLMGKRDQYLAMATNSNDIKVYDTKTMNSKILKGHTDIVLALTSYKTYLLSSGKDNSVRLWKADFENFSFECVAIGIKHTNAVGSVDIGKMSGDFFVSVSQDQCMKLWKMPKKVESIEEPISLQCINTTLAHEKDINCATISPNDRYIATSSQDKTAKLWDATDLKLLGVFRGHRRGVWSVRFSPVDQVIVTSAADCTMRLWNITDMSCLKSFEGHESSVLRCEFISNGMQLLSTGADGLIKLWTIKTSECIQTLDKHESKVWTLAITSDESEMFTGGSDSQLIRWSDVTAEKKLEVRQKKKEEILQEQELNNLLSQKKMMKALRLALNLNRPNLTLKTNFQTITSNRFLNTPSIGTPTVAIVDLLSSFSA